MADSIPAALRQADITIWKCATKAAQLQTVKPIIAYWCMHSSSRSNPLSLGSDFPGEYWVVNQILAKQLHTLDEDVLRYTALMDKLEQVRSLCDPHH
jgi:vacuolar protein sorting-associated protein VTA1